MSDLSVYPVGEAALILDEARQSLFTLDARSAFAWCCLSEGYKAPDLVEVFVLEFELDRAEAERGVNRIIGELSGLGLLDDHRDKRPRDSARHQPKVVHRADSATKSFACRIELLDTAFEVRFPCKKLLKRFRSIMGHLESEIHTVESLVTIHNRHDGFAIIVDGIEVEHSRSDDRVAPQVMSVISAQAVNRASFAACLHAAALTWDGQAILVPGPSGTGKSCLTLALARAGLTCLSDEKVLVDPDTLQVRGVPLSCCIKEGAWQAMTSLHPTLLKAATHTRGDGKRVKYLSLASPEVSARSWPVEHIVFPVYREGAPASRRLLEPTETLHRLLSSCMAWRAPLTPSFVKNLISWVERAQCHELRYGCNSAAVREFSELLGRGDVSKEVLPSP